MAKSKFPSTLYVKIEHPDKDEEYLIADADIESLAEIGEVTTVAEYSLVRVAPIKVEINWNSLRSK